MSADNWAVCPRCKKVRATDLADIERRVAESYGTVPVEEFDAARDRLAEAQAAPVERTFREDYEVGVEEDGEFYVIYRGGCRECGLTHEYRYTDQLAVTP